MSRHEALANRLMAAIERGDLDEVRACYAPSLSLWMNVEPERSRDRDEAVAVLAGFVDMTASRRYDITSRTDTPSGYLQEHVLHVTGSNGAEVASPACLIVSVDESAADGPAIDSIREYLDSRALAAVFR